VLCIEVHIRFGRLRVDPHLSQDTDVHGTHQLLPYDIQTMRNMELDYIFIILESTISKIMVVFVIVPQALAKKIQAVKMMETFNISGVSSTILPVDLHLVWSKTGSLCERGWDDQSSIIDTERFPGCINFWARGLSVDILFEQRAIELCKGI